MDTLFIKFQMFKNNGSFRSPASEPAGILVQYRCLGNKVFQKARPHCPRDFSHKYTAVFPQAEIKRSSSLIIRLQISDENLPQALTLRVVFLFFSHSCPPSHTSGFPMRLQSLSALLPVSTLTLTSLEQRLPPHTRT